MQDNDQIRLFAPAIEAFVRTQTGDATVVFLQNDQPTVQGMTSVPTVYFTKLFDVRRHFMSKVDKISDDGTQYVHTETQSMETHWQFMATARQDPAADGAGLTASDYANMAAQGLQHDDVLGVLAAQSLSVLRITQVRSLKVQNGEGQFEDWPSFDLVVSHEAVTVTTTPIATVKDLRVESI